MRYQVIAALAAGALSACSDFSSEPSQEPLVAPSIQSLPPPHEPGAIVFAAQTGSRDFDIFTISPEGSGLTNLTNDPQHTESGPSWSPDGRRIAFSRASVVDPSARRWDLFVMEADGTNLIGLTDTPDVDELTPDWSPDGRHIVFQKREGSGPLLSSLHVLNVRSATEHSITEPSQRVYGAPRWSPDGRQLIFSASLGGGATRIHIINADGTNEKVLTQNVEPFAANPDWSTNGRHIVFNGPGGEVPTSIWVMDRDGTNARLLIAQEGGGVVWSPNGKQLAFGGLDGLMIIDVDGSDLRPLGVRSHEMDWRAGRPIRWRLRQR